MIFFFCLSCVFTDSFLRLGAELRDVLYNLLKEGRVVAGSKSSFAFRAALKPHSHVNFTPYLPQDFFVWNHPSCNSISLSLMAGLLSVCVPSVFQGPAFSSCRAQKENKSVSCLTALSEASAPAEPRTACAQPCQVSAHAWHLDYVCVDHIRLKVALTAEEPGCSA